MKEELIKTKFLTGRVALVTGASRGIGKGIAKTLAALGAIVYVTGRSTDPSILTDGLGGTIHDTAHLILELGGKCTAIQCDHQHQEQIARVFQIIEDNEGRLDILVNNAWPGYQGMVELIDQKWVWTWQLPFWQQPLWRYDSMMNVTVRSNFICSQLATRIMLKQNSGLIVNLSYWAAKKHIGNVPYGVSKAATDKLTSDMAAELKDFDITVVSLYPGLVRTEGVVRAAEYFDLSNSESTEYQGLAIAHLYKDPRKKERSGTVVLSAALGDDYNFSDFDGKRPKPVSIGDA